MPAKTYGYAENSADVDALQAYAGVDVGGYLGSTQGRPSIRTPGY